MAPLTQSDINILPFTPPTTTSRTLTTTLHPSATDTLNPSTSLSFEFRANHKEVFAERITYRELDVRDNGTIGVTVPAIEIRDQRAGETEVLMHVWKGEKLLGSWDVGTF